MTQELIRLSQTLPVWIWNLIVILFSILIGFLIKIGLIPLVRKEAIAQSSYSLFRSFIKRFNSVLSVFIPLVVFNSLLPLTNFTPKTRSEEHTSELQSRPHLV